MPGFQGASGQPAMIPFWRAGQGTEPARYANVPSEGLQVTREQIAGQQKLQQGALANTLAQLGAENQYAKEQAGVGSYYGQLAANAQREFQGQQAAADRANQLSIAQMPWNFKNKVFDTFSPLMSGLFGDVKGMLNQPPPGPPGGSGGQNTPQTPVTVGGIWTPQQVEQQVNAQQAGNAAKAASQQRANQTQLAGQGWGTNSPLLAALNAGTQNALMGANAAARRDTEFNAAQGNAKQLLATQQAAEDQWKDFNTTDIARRQLGIDANRNNLNFASSLVAALAGMM